MVPATLDTLERQCRQSSKAALRDTGTCTWSKEYIGCPPQSPQGLWTELFIYMVLRDRVAVTLIHATVTHDIPVMVTHDIPAMVPVTIVAWTAAILEV